MSMDLYFWKAPVIDDADEAGTLLDRYFDDEDTSVFEPSPAIAAMAEKLLQLYPVKLVFGDEALAAIREEERGRYTEEGLAELLSAGVYIQDEDSPWADLPFEQSDRLLGLSIRWHTPNQVLDDVVRLAAEQDLVIYDPQGPDVYRAREAPEQQPLVRPTAKDFLNVMLLFLPIAGATLAAWRFIPWGWLRWPLVAVGLFFTIAASIVVYSTVAAAMGWLDDAPRTS